MARDKGIYIILTQLFSYPRTLRLQYTGRCYFECNQVLQTFPSWVYLTLTLKYTLFLPTVFFTFTTFRRSSYITKQRLMGTQMQYIENTYFNSVSPVLLCYLTASSRVLYLRSRGIKYYFKICVSFLITAFELLLAIKPIPLSPLKIKKETINILEKGSICLKESNTLLYYKSMLINEGR